MGLSYLSDNNSVSTCDASLQLPYSLPSRRSSPPAQNSTVTLLIP